MDKQELKQLEARLHYAVTSVINNYIEAAGDKSNHCYNNVLDGIYYINDVLSLLR